MKSGRFFKRTAFVLALLLSLVLVGQAAFAGVLSDIQGHWAAGEIEKAVEQGYVKGYPDGCFRPDRAVSRAEFVALLGGALELEESDYRLSFKDVSESDWFYGRLASVVEAGYMVGYLDGTFRPQQSITRQEAAVCLSKLLDVPDVSVDLQFKDTAQIGSWAQPGVAKMVHYGLIKGRPDNTFAPLLPITRAESVVMINQVLSFLKGEKPPIVDEEKPVLSVEPLDQEKRVKTTAKITATYLDQGKGVKDEKVQFTVSRDNKIELEQELITDKNGQAVLEYTGPDKPATDKVKVAVGDLEATATVKWVAASGGGGGGGGGGSSTPSEYKIELTVKDAGGAAVGDAAVELYAGDALAPSKTLKTGSDGKVSFKELSKGNYRISVQKKVDVDNYLVGYKDIDSLSSDQKIDIVVKDALVLSGVLKDADGSPLADTPVVAEVNPIFRTVTDRAGQYTLPVASGADLPDAFYSVMALVGDKKYEVAKVPARIEPQKLVLPDFQAPVDEGTLPAMDAAVDRIQKMYSFLDAGDRQALDAARNRVNQMSDSDLTYIIEPVVSRLNEEARDALSSSYDGGADAFFKDAVKEAAAITYSSDQSQLKGQLEAYRSKFGPGVSALLGLTDAESAAVDDLFELFLDVEKEVPNVIGTSDVEELVNNPYSYFKQNIDSWAEEALLNAVQKKHPQFNGSLAAVGLTTGDLFAARNRLSEKVDPDQNGEIALVKAVVRSSAVGEGPSFVVKGQTVRYGLKVLNVPIEKMVNWESSDESVAAMGSSEGDKNYLTAKRAGMTTITAYKNDPATDWIWKIDVKVL